MRDNAAAGCVLLSRAGNTVTDFLSRTISSPGVSATDGRVAGVVSCLHPGCDPVFAKEFPVSDAVQLQVVPLRDNSYSKPMRGCPGSDGLSLNTYFSRLLSRSLQLSSSVLARKL